MSYDHTMALVERLQQGEALLRQWLDGKTPRTTTEAYLRGVWVGPGPPRPPTPAPPPLRASTCPACGYEHPSSQSCAEAARERT